jgi:hypothetical protein
MGVWVPQREEVGRRCGLSCHQHAPRLVCRARGFLCCGWCNLFQFSIETDASFFSPVYLVVGGGCTAFPLSEPRMYQCPHCPNEPPYAGASGLWYHMKRHHGAVTRPYNKSKAGAGGKPRTPKKKKDKASKKVKNNHHDVGQGGSMYDPPLTPGGRSKFPVSHGSNTCIIVAIPKRRRIRKTITIRTSPWTTGGWGEGVTILVGVDRCTWATVARRSWRPCRPMVWCVPPCCL